MTRASLASAFVFPEAELATSAAHRLRTVTGPTAALADLAAELVPTKTKLAVQAALDVGTVRLAATVTRLAAIRISHKAKLAVFAACHFWARPRLIRAAAVLASVFTAVGTKLTEPLADARRTGLPVRQAGARFTTVVVCPQTKRARLIARQLTAVTFPTSTLARLTSGSIPLEAEFAVHVALNTRAGLVQRRTLAGFTTIFVRQKAKWTSLLARQPRAACWWTVTSAYLTSILIPRTTKIAPVPTTDRRTVLRLRQTLACFASILIPRNAILTRFPASNCWTISRLAAALAKLTFLTIPFQPKFAGCLATWTARAMLWVYQTAARFASVCVGFEAKLAVIITSYIEARI